MIIIQCNDNHVEERKYIIEVIFGDIYGLEYELQFSKNFNSWKVLQNDVEFEINDDFFSRDVLYTIENIPKQKIFFENKADLPIIYGDTTSISAFLGLDVFGAAFFMLTRWEEMIIKDRGIKNRFESKSSLAGKWGFLKYPVVNAYCDLLYFKLKIFGFDLPKDYKDKREYTKVITHDVDLPFYFMSIKRSIKIFLGDIIKRRSLSSAAFTAKYFLSTMVLNKKDPYDTFDYLMDLSERASTKSYFFFMSGGLTEYDNYYKIDDKRVVKIIDNIISRGHFLGIHPSFDAYNDERQFRLEKERLENTIREKITFGRQHYLRFEVPTTWQIWEDNGMEWESTMSYHDKEGFRCGICYPFRVYNVKTRKRLNLIEKPLILMDQSIGGYQNLSMEEITNTIEHLKQEVKKYRGDFIFLWHNSAMNSVNWYPYQTIFEKTILS